MRRHYLYYSVEDLLNDDLFVQHVTKPNTISDKAWLGFLEYHPEFRNVYNEARDTILIYQEINKVGVPEQIVLDTWNNIDKELNNKPKNSVFKYGLAIAATILFLAYCGSQFFKTKDLPLKEKKSWVEYTNKTDKVMRVDLIDGSVVTLEPESYLKTPNRFDGDTRKVTLKGEAFFDIARDTSKPFIVYAQEAIIQVLGTSFFVKVKEDEKDVEVIVKSGKVAVYKRSDLEKQRQQPNVSAKPLFVTPNQKVVMNKETQNMTRRLTAAPILVKPISKLKRSRFNNRPVTEIFSGLEDAYGVTIYINRLELKDCALTTTLTNQSLFEKLDIICEALGLSYIESDGKIIIRGTCD